MCAIHNFLIMASVVVVAPGELARLRTFKKYPNRIMMSAGVTAPVYYGASVRDCAYRCQFFGPVPCYAFSAARLQTTSTSSPGNNNWFECKLSVGGFTWGPASKSTLYVGL
jgi:hypothetical protein